MFYKRGIKHRVERPKKKRETKRLQKKNVLYGHYFSIWIEKKRSNFPQEAVASLELEAMKLITEDFLKKLIQKEKNKKEAR